MAKNNYKMIPERRNIFTVSLDFLSSESGKLFDDTKKTIDLIRDQGDFFLANTRRSWNYSQKIYNDLGVRNAILLNGALIYDFKNNEVIYKKRIKSKTWKPLVKYLFENSFTFTIDFIDSQETYNLNEVRDSNLQTNYEEDKSLINSYEKLIKHINETKMEILKISVSSLSENESNEIFKKFSKTLNVSLIEGTTIDFSSHSCSNAKAYLWFVKHMHLESYRLVSFGSKHNQIPMFKEAMFSFATKDSYNLIRTSATYITDSFNKNGFKKGIEFFYWKGL